MHLGLGFGRSRATALETISPTITFDLATAIPAQLTFTRASTATYRDSNGVWRSASSGTARCGSAAHYPVGSTTGYFWMEPGATNKLTDRNANPTDTTGWSKTGDAASVLDDVTAPGTKLTDAGLAVLVSGGKTLRLDNTAGVATAAAESTAQYGVTTAHVISAWIYVVSGTVTLTRTGGGTPETKTITANSGFVRHALKVTPNANSDLMKISITAGGDCYFILAQMEASTFIDEEGYGVPTNPIITSAVAATRAVDRLNTTSLTSAAWFNGSAGTLMFDFYPVAYNPSAIQYLCAFANGSATTGGSANFHALRLSNDKGYTRVNVLAAGVGAAQSSIDKPRLRFRSNFAYTWKSSEYSFVSPVTYLTLTGYTDPTGPYDRLEIGKLHNGSSPFFGGFKSITVYNVHRDVAGLITEMLSANDKAMLVLGQSNGFGAFLSSDGLDNTGQRRGVAVLDAYETSTRNWMINACTNGSALLEENDGGSGYWLDDNGVAGQIYAWGNAWNHAEPIIRGWANSAAEISVVIWDQGDGGISLVNPARHKAGLLNIANAVHAITGTIPLLLNMKGRRGDTTQTQMIRNIYHELDADVVYSYIHTSPEVGDLTLSDTVHYAEVNGYDKYYERVIRKGLSIIGHTVTGGVNGPAITGVIRSGTTVTVTIAHDAGTDFTPTSGIQGFYFYDNATPITVTAAARTNATTITLTLNSAPSSGIETLYHYYSGMNGVSASNIMRDNAANAVPLRSAKITL